MELAADRPDRWLEIHAHTVPRPGARELPRDGFRRAREAAPGLAPERGGSIFASVTHPALWRSLRAEHGLALDEIEDCMTATLTAQLLANR